MNKLWQKIFGLSILYCLFIITLLLLISRSNFLWAILTSTGCENNEKCRVNNGDSYEIHTSCASPYDCKVVNNNSGGHIFIPIKTCSEWQEFLGHLPSGVSIDDCVSLCNLPSCQGCSCSPCTTISATQLWVNPIGPAWFSPCDNPPCARNSRGFWGWCKVGSNCAEEGTDMYGRHDEVKTGNGWAWCRYYDPSDGKYRISCHVCLTPCH
jgi:hypothetical protein